MWDSRIPLADYDLWAQCHALTNLEMHLFLRFLGFHGNHVTATFQTTSIMCGVAAYEEFTSHKYSAFIKDMTQEDLAGPAITCLTIVYFPFL